MVSGEQQDGGDTFIVQDFNNTKSVVFHQFVGYEIPPVLLRSNQCVNTSRVDS